MSESRGETVVTSVTQVDIEQMRDQVFFEGPERKRRLSRYWLLLLLSAVMVIPAGYTLDRVHDVIQAAMGWQNSHLHMFRIACREYGPAYLDDELETLDEKQFRIGDLVKTGDLAGYEYDFGDGWEHEVAVRPTLRHVHSLLQPALAVREIFIAGIFSELGLEGGDDSSGVFLGTPVGTRHEDHPEVSRTAWGDRVGMERPVVAQVVGDHGAAFGPG